MALTRNSVFGLVTLMPKMQSPSESLAATRAWWARLCSTICSALISRVLSRGRLPAVWSAPCAVAIMVMPVASTTRGS